MNDHHHPHRRRTQEPHQSRILAPKRKALGPSCITRVATSGALEQAQRETRARADKETPVAERARTEVQNHV